MHNSEAVSADPFSPWRPTKDVCQSVCFACNAKTNRQTLQTITLTSTQIRKRSAVDTGSFENPFGQLDPQQSAPILLCTPCRNRSSGWGAICEPKKFGKNNVLKFLNAWKARVRVKKKMAPTKVCGVCKKKGDSMDKAGGGPSRQERLPRRALNLYDLSVCSEKFRLDFTTEFCRLAEMEEDVVQDMFSFPSEFYFCYIHLNHVRYAKEIASANDEGVRGAAQGFCLFSGHGCQNGGSRLRPLPKIEGDDLDSIERKAQFHEVISDHSSGMFSGSDVYGLYACSQCLWTVTQGQLGCAPQQDIASLSDVVDRWLVRCVFYSLEDPAFHISPPTVELIPDLADVAIKLRKSVKEPVKCVQVLPFGRVVQCRRSIVELRNSSSSQIAHNVDPRTLEARIAPVLSSKNIHLKKISTRTRCYIVGGSLEAALASKVSVSSSIKRSALAQDDRLKLLDTVGKQFQERTSKYWNGDWSLNEEISSIPLLLWRDYMLQMASKRKRLSWHIAAASNDSDIFDLFPLCNKRTVLPRPSLEDCLSNPSSNNSRADLLLCIRTLKVIEQVVFSRTNSVSGPLTVCLSIAGIVELSPSFKSIENALGMTLSYNVTEAYRLRLIAERERAGRGAWETVPFLYAGCIPLCQFDNWDILPLHSVKADGKATPKVNGSLVQGVTRKRRRPRNKSEENPVKRQRLDWRPVTILGDRFSFSDSFASPQKDIVLEQFFDIVYGLVLTHRDELIAQTEPLPRRAKKNRQTTRKQRTKLSKKGVINFRSLLLSAFQPHGGAAQNEEEPFDQHVVYIDISRETASSILTVRRMLHLIETITRPGAPGSPRFVIVSGDQPSYKMLVELWLASWRESRKNPSGKKTNEPLLHEWLIPFPGFFHAEKQAMYSLCKELIDGLGLSELAGCVGLSLSHVENILKHSHARNNRAFLFSLTCALVIHTIDKVFDEDPRLYEEVMSVLSELGKDKVVTTEDGKIPEGFRDRVECEKERGLQSKTINVLPEVVTLGSKVRKAVNASLCTGPNGKHFVGTVLFGALLPTVGFHVLSRTGHTDVTEVFWFRLTYMLHASNHLKYQELSLFYAFLRGILPPVVIDELHNVTPGSSVLKLPSFTGSNKTLLDDRGWTYVHLDELLEMLIVRHLKSLSVAMLSHLENAAAWLMQVSRFRSLARRVTGASRSYGRITVARDIGEENGPLRFYDRNTPQSRSVNAMLSLMRARGFLDANHRGSDWLTNVFCEPPKRMANTVDQTKILNIEEHGRLTTALHASVLFPEAFGRLSEQDRTDYFGGKKFKKWTSSRRIQTPRQSMLKDGGCVTLAPANARFCSKVKQERPKDRSAVVKALTDRRRLVSKAKDLLYLAEREAARNSNSADRCDAATQWDVIHQNRHLISSKADAFFEPSGSPCHPQKSKMLKVSTRGGRAQIHTLNEAFRTATGNEITRDRFRFPVESYFSIQIDVMNAVHNPGNGAGRGTRLVDVITAKMKRLLRQWVTGSKAKCLRQIHLHIDDPSMVLSQKQVEQGRRDNVRQRTSDYDMNSESGIALSLPDCLDELVIPWGILIRDRSYKDQLSSLHLLCGAIAAEELAKESEKDLTVYLHGGAFVIPRNCSGTHASALTLRRATGHDKEHFRGTIVADFSTRDPDNMPEDNFIIIPRGTALVFDTRVGMRLGDFNIRHGEAETRIVSVFKHYIKPCVDAIRVERSRPSGTTLASNSGGTDAVAAGDDFTHSCVVLSDDTDVFLILILAKAIRGYSILHVLTDSVHDTDRAVQSLYNASTDPESIAGVYAFAGCDFSPGTHGIPHDTYLSAYIRNVHCVGKLSRESGPEAYETIMCLAYLQKYGLTQMCTRTEKNLYRDRLLSKLNSADMSQNDVAKEMKRIFVCDEMVGSNEWKVEVRNFVADNASSLCGLVPPLPHISMQAARVRFITHHYWSKSENEMLTPSAIGGCSAMHGYNERGEAIFENELDVETLDSEIRNLISMCGCKGRCNTKRCSCQKGNRKCVGCSCSPDVCENRIETIAVKANNNGEAQGRGCGTRLSEIKDGTTDVGERMKYREGPDESESESESSSSSVEEPENVERESVSSCSASDAGGVIDELIDDDL